MARTLKRIQDSMATSIEGNDPGIDTVKGPVFDIFIRPQAAQLRAVELLYDDLSRRYSLDYVLSQNPEVLALYGANHGVRRASGRASRGNVTFFTFSTISADEVVVIPAGTVVTTTDTSLAYRTLRDAFILGNTLSSFYNASSRRYEVRVPVAAVGSGDIFDVPPNRIINIQGNVPGIDGVVNLERVEGGTSIESNARFGRRIRSKFNGLALGSGSGLESLIRDFNTSSIDDISMIFSSDYDNFHRKISRAAWDVYIIGSESDTAEANYIGDGVKNSFALPLTPALSVTDVQVNGTSVSFDFIPDTSDELRKSTQANDRVMLPLIPGLNDEVTISYSYDKLIRDTQDYVDKISVDLYRSDTLVRKAIPIPIRVHVLIQILSSFDETDATASAFASVSDFINTNSFVSILFANELQSTVSADVAGVANVTIIEFTRDLTGVLPIETIEFRPFEYPETTDSLITIEVRR